MRWKYIFNLFKIVELKVIVGLLLVLFYVYVKIIGL
jgi:hypothetical protein